MPMAQSLKMPALRTSRSSSQGSRKRNKVRWPLCAACRMSLEHAVGMQGGLDAWYLQSLHDVTHQNKIFKIALPHLREVKRWLRGRIIELHISHRFFPSNMLDSP